MTPTNRFCTNCGTSLDPAWRFCGSCGQPLAAAGVSGSPVTAPQAPVFNPPAGIAVEKLLGIIPSVSRKKGILAIEGFNVIVTEKRMVFALMTNEMIKQEAQRASKGVGFFGGMAAAATVGLTFYKRYLTMPADAALAESLDNFAVSLSSIRQVKVEAGKEIDTYQSIKASQGAVIQRQDYSSGKFEIETAGETLKFELPGSSLGMAVETLKKAGLYR